MWSFAWPWVKHTLLKRFCCVSTWTRKTNSLVGHVKMCCLNTMCATILLCNYQCGYKEFCWQNGVEHCKLKNALQTLVAIKPSCCLARFRAFPQKMLAWSRTQCCAADMLSLNTSCAKSVKCRTHIANKYQTRGKHVVQHMRYTDTAKHPGSSTFNVRHYGCVNCEDIRTAAGGTNQNCNCSWKGVDMVEKCRRYEELENNLSKDPRQTLALSKKTWSRPLDGGDGQGI